MNIIKRSGLKPYLAVLLCVVIVLSSINLSSATIPKQGEESPILLVDYYAEGKPLEVFNWTEIENGLEIVFKNSSKDSETVDLLIYVTVDGVKDLQELDLRIDGGAIIDSMRIDLCDEAFNVLSNYESRSIGADRATVSVDGEDIASQVSEVGASCVKFTATIRDWSADTEHHFVVAVGGAEGPPPGEGGEGTEEPNVYILYNEELGVLTFFNFSFTEGELFIMFSNETADSGTVEILIIAEPRAVEFLTGFNASIDNGATIESVSIDFYDNDFNFIEYYQAYDFGTPECSVPFDSREAIGAMENATADLIGFKMVIGSWAAATTYTLHIVPFFSELLYYETEDTIYVDPSVANLPPEIRAWWQLYNETWNGTWTYRDITWEFGPRAQYKIFCQNTTTGIWYPVTHDTWIEINAPVKVNITIPKLLFEKGTKLGRIYMSWHTWGVNISADLSITYDEWGQWYTWSSVTNYSDPYGGYGTAEFFTLDKSQTTVIETSDEYLITIVGQFNNLTPKGIYDVWLQIYDNESNYLSGWSSYSLETGESLFQRVAIGGPWSEVEVYYDIMYGGTYIAEILNTEYELIHTIGINQTFIIRLNITGISDEDFSNASVTTRIWSIKTYVNKTGWHDEYRIYHGGWVYNETLGTYVWDPNATIITREWVYGTYLEEQYIWLGKKFNVTYYEWNETTGEYYPEQGEYWAEPIFVIFYNNTDGTYSCFLAYEYWNQTLKVDEWGNQYIESIRHWEMEDLPPELNFYELINVTKTVEENKIVLEFKGKFTGNPGQDLYLDYYVYSTSCRLWDRDWEWMMENARQISVEKPVVKIKIRDSSGKTNFQSYYVTEPNDWFLVEAVIEGGSTIVSDVDGISVRFNSWDYYWGENETIWMEIEIIVTVDLREGTVETLVYNVTNKEVWEYGTYEKWNETTGTWEEVEGWHWEHYSFNQSSGEWVNKWLDWRNKDTLVNKTCLNVHGYNTFTAEDGAYVIQVNMSFTEYATDRRYSFSVNLLNLTYGPDYSKPWGENLVEDWQYSVVYTLKNGSVEIYVPTPTDRDYVETLSGEKYLVFKKPYIVINGNKLPLKEIKYWNGYQYEYRLLREEYDVITGRFRYYYTLENGTKIPVYEGYHAFIYNLTVYNSTSGTSFNVLSFSSYSWWDPYRETSYIYTINGNKIWLENCWITESKKVATIKPLEFAGYFTLINGTTWINVTKEWIEWDYINLADYIVLENGTKIYLKYDDQYLYQYYFEKNGKRYYIEYPSEFYIGNYSGTTLTIPGWFRRTWYYTLIGEEKVELPYEGVSYEYEWIGIWDLESPKSQGGVVPEDEYAYVNGTLYLIHYYSNTTYQGYIVLDGKIVNVTKGSGKYTNIAGKDVWNVGRIGFKMFLGNLTNQGSYDRENLLELQVKSFSYNEFNGTITLFNDTVLNMYHKYRVVFYEIKVNGTTYYTVNYEPHWYWVNKSGIIDSGYAFYLLNGSKLKVRYWGDYEFVGIVIVELGDYSYTRPETFTWNGETYNTTVYTEDMMYDLLYEYWCVNVSGVFYDIIDADYVLRPYGEVPPRFYLDLYKYQDKFAIYNVTIEGTEYTLYPTVAWKKEVILTWGHPVGWHLEEFPWDKVSYRKDVWDIIVGSPDWGLWGYRKWTIDPDTGAIDLDGDLSTTDDQFYVKRVYFSESGWNQTYQGLDVHIEYDPNPVIPGDELYFDAWMGIATSTYWNRWNETYYWYYTNMTPVSAETMAMINETLWDTERNCPKPGYWEIARMARNMTWEDYIEKARREGWDWVKEEVSWSWLWFGFQQSYWVSAGENETFRSYHVDLRYEYAGMFIYNDTDGDTIMDEEEATHYFIPHAIGNVTFVTPGEAFGIYNETGTLVLPVNESIEFGVSYLDINGTMFPFGRSYYAWYGEDVYGTDLKTFQERPVDASVDELSFKLHFYVENSTETNSTEAHIKIDQHVGDWNLDLPSGIAVLENLSLSLNYYIYAETSGTWEVVSEDGTPITPEQIVEASRISLDTAGLKFAEVNMGDTYLWGGNLSMVCNVSTHTVPLSTFVETYTGYESETSVGGWTFQSTMYFLSVGFPKWGGHFVYEDPEVVVYSGKEKKTIVSSLAEFLAGWIPTLVGAAGEERPPEERPPLPLLYLVIIAVVAVAVVFVIIRKRRQAAIVKVNGHS